MNEYMFSIIVLSFIVSVILTFCVYEIVQFAHKKKFAKNLKIGDKFVWVWHIDKMNNPFVDKSRYIKTVVDISYNRKFVLLNDGTSETMKYLSKYAKIIEQ